MLNNHDNDGRAGKLRWRGQRTLAPNDGARAAPPHGVEQSRAYAAEADRVDPRPVV
jgi:hypothetical protein